MRAGVELGMVVRVDVGIDVRVGMGVGVSVSTGVEVRVAVVAVAAGVGEPGQGLYRSISVRRPVSGSSYWPTAHTSPGPGPEDGMAAAPFR